MLSLRRTARKKQLKVYNQDTRMIESWIKNLFGRLSLIQKILIQLTIFSWYGTVHFFGKGCRSNVIWRDNKESKIHCSFILRTLCRSIMKSALKLRLYIIKNIVFYSSLLGKIIFLIQFVEFCFIFSFIVDFIYLFFIYKSKKVWNSRQAWSTIELP